MPRMTRDDLFTIARSHGYKKGVALTEQQASAIKTDLVKGLQDTNTPPTRIFDGTGKFRVLSLEEAVDNLLEELV